MLALSLLANAALVVALFVIMSKARKKIVEEKCATFAGCVSAMTSGIGIEDLDRRFKTVSFFLASLRASDEADKVEMEFYLKRASVLRVFREVTLADVGEHLRLLALRTVDDNDEPGSRMLEYISQAQIGEQEPSELWGGQLAEANMVAEKKMLGIYRRQVMSAPIRLFD